MIKPPCKQGGVDCLNRTVGCQSGCTYYLTWSEEREKEQDYTNQEKRILYAICDYNERKQKK